MRQKRAKIPLPEASKKWIIKSGTVFRPGHLLSTNSSPYTRVTVNVDRQIVKGKHEEETIESVSC